MGDLVDQKIRLDPGTLYADGLRAYSCPGCGANAKMAHRVFDLAVCEMDSDVIAEFYCGTKVRGNLVGKKEETLSEECKRRSEKQAEEKKMKEATLTTAKLKTCTEHLGCVVVYPGESCPICSFTMVPPAGPPASVGDVEVINRLRTKYIKYGMLLLPGGRNA